MIRKAVDPREDAAGFVLVIVAGHRSFDDSGKYNGKAKSHDPIEVAHEELLESRGVRCRCICSAQFEHQSVEMMRVLFDVFSIKFARHHAVRPSRVKQHDWKEDQRHKEHDLKRELGAGAVPKRQTGIEHR